MVRKCRFCGTEISFGESSTAAICPNCGELVFTPKSQSEDTKSEIPPQDAQAAQPVSAAQDVPGATDDLPPCPPFPITDVPGEADTPADAQYDADLKKRVEDWEQKKKKRRKRLFCGVGFAVLLGVFAAVFCILILPGFQYRKALGALENGDYQAAFARFEELEGFRDSDEKRSEAGIFLLADAQAGDTVMFGQFEQDNDASNGKENLQWRVLAREEDRLLLITQSVLDAAAYNTADEDTTWETCSLREWLNSTFLTAAFSESEQRLLQQTELSPQANPCYPTSPGNQTTDRVFLLGIEDTQLYFADSDSDRISAATEYALQRKIVVNETTGGSPWWVRSPGYEGRLAAFVRSDGKGNADGTNVTTAECGVRPAVWLDLGNR